MKPSTRILLAVAALFGTAVIAASAEPETPAPAAAAAPTTAMIADLRGEAVVVYGYGSWKDRINPTATGLAILGSKGAQGDGGVCGTLAPVYNLGGATWIEIALGVGQTNEATTVVIGLNDVDGTLVTARVRIDQIVPGQPVWFRVPLAEFRPVGGEYAGRVPGMDFTTINQWHVQGEWAVKKPHQFVIIALRARG
jgi:hypothetical protein